MPDLAPSPKGNTPNQPFYDRDRRSLATERVVKEALKSFDERDARELSELLYHPDHTARRKLNVAVTNTSGFNEASTETMVHILKRLLQESDEISGLDVGKRGAFTSRLATFLEHPNFARLASKDQIALLELQTNEPYGQNSSLRKLLSFNGSDGNPLLGSTDSQGNSLVKNLAAYRNAKFHPDVASAGISPQKSFAAMLETLAEQVCNVNYGHRGTGALVCAMCKIEPAEYLRLVTGLLQEKSVSARGGKLLLCDEVLALEKHRIQIPEFAWATPSAIFEVSLLKQITAGTYEYANDNLFEELTPKQLNDAVAVLFGSQVSAKNIGPGGVLVDRKPPTRWNNSPLTSDPAAAIAPARSELRWVVKEPNFKRLTDKEQIAIIELLAHNPRASGVGEALGTLLSRNAADGSPLLQSTDIRGVTLLQNLTTLNSAHFHPDITAAGISPQAALRSAILEVAAPARHIDHGNRGASAAAAIQDVLCRSQPSEYVRLLTGLMSNKSVAGRGGTLSVVDGSLTASRVTPQGEPDLRSHTSRIFQSALLERAAKPGTYLYEKDELRRAPANPLVEGAMLGGFIGQGIPAAQLPHRSASQLNLSEMLEPMDVVFGKGEHDLFRGTGKNIHSALQAAGSPSVISWRCYGKQHAMVYVESDERYVYLKDRDGGSPELESFLSFGAEASTLFNGAHVRIWIQDFEQNVDAAIIKRRSNATAERERLRDTLPSFLGPALDGASEKFDGLVLPPQHKP